MEAFCELRNQRDSTSRERARSDRVTGLAWYVTYTCPRHEKSVFKHLKDRGISSCLPASVSWAALERSKESVGDAAISWVCVCAYECREPHRGTSSSRQTRIHRFLGQTCPSRNRRVMENLQLSLLGPMRVLPHPFLKSGCVESAFEAAR